MPSIARPSKTMLPVSWCKAPDRQLTKVLLPEPLGPMRPSRSPTATESSISCRATNPPNRLPSPLTSRIGRSITTGTLGSSTGPPPPPVALHEPDNSVRRDDHEQNQQHADDQQV